MIQPGIFVGKGPAGNHANNARRALIVRRHRAMLAAEGREPMALPPPRERNRKSLSDERRELQRVNALKQHARKREKFGYDDRASEHAGSPDFEISQLPDSLLEEK